MLIKNKHKIHFGKMDPSISNVINKENINVTKMRVVLNIVDTCYQIKKKKKKLFFIQRKTTRILIL